MTTPNYASLWPIIEFVWNFINKVNYQEQHINKFTIEKLKNFLEKRGLNIEVINSFFIISPFILKKQDEMMNLERKLFPKSGSIIISKSKL